MVPPSIIPIVNRTIYRIRYRYFKGGRTYTHKRYPDASSLRAHYAKECMKLTIQTGGVYEIWMDKKETIETVTLLNYPHLYVIPNP